MTVSMSFRGGPFVELVTMFTILGGCGGADGRPAAPRTELSIVVRADSGAREQRYELRCDPPRGSHPEPAAACAVAATVAPSAFAPVPPHVVCTQVFGGPQVARVEGVVRGARIDATFSRNNGCEIARWNELRPLVPLPKAHA